MFVELRLSVQQHVELLASTSQAVTIMANRESHHFAVRDAFMTDSTIELELSLDIQVFCGKNADEESLSLST